MLQNGGQNTKIVKQTSMMMIVPVSPPYQKDHERSKGGRKFWKKMEFQNSKIFHCRIVLRKAANTAHRYATVSAMQRDGMFKLVPSWSRCSKLLWDYLEINTFSM